MQKDLKLANLQNIIRVRTAHGDKYLFLKNEDKHACFIQGFSMSFLQLYGHIVTCVANYFHAIMHSIHTYKHTCMYACVFLI